ncbi:hypothetical protein V6N12_074585 [Hibiscus sabdariffa]|uniref:Uncharacterized protein n=1 Tax=Hibiscus sabdariffa TaxID=183260 RepID=A0ABR2BXV3_9ROSI
MTDFIEKECRSVVMGLVVLTSSSEGDEGAVVVAESERVTIQVVAPAMLEACMRIRASECESVAMYSSKIEVSEEAQ